MKNYFFFFIIITIVFGTYSWCLSASREINMVAIGDSITYGTGDPSKKGYIEKLRLKIEKAHSSPVQLHNFGVPKYTTQDILKLLEDEEKRETIKEAHIIVLFVGTNDFRKSAKYQFSPLNENVKKQGKHDFISNLHKIINRIRTENSTAPVVLMGLYHPYTEYLNHQEIQRVLEDWNSQIYLETKKFNNIHYVPTMDLFVSEKKEHYFSDSLHPNPNGYDMIANRIFEELEKIKSPY